MNDAVLLTGGSGLLALNWATRLRERCRVVLGLHARQVQIRGVESALINLESVDELSRTIDSLQPVVVVHTAGMTNVEACEAEPQRARHVNVQLARNVARACKNGATAMVHVSTDHLFSGTEQLVDEDAQVSPVNVYGRTKAEAEVSVLSEFPKALVVRTNFYGWGPSYRQSFSDVILGALRTRRPLSLFDDVHYTPIVMQELVHAVKQLLERRANGIYHVVGDERLSKYQFGCRIAAEFGLDPGPLTAGRLSDHSSSARRPHEMSLSNRKVCRLLGRKLGSVDEHVRSLLQQQNSEPVREVQAL